MVVCWLDLRESLQNKELNKRNIGWKTSLLFTNIQSIPAFSWSVARQRRVTKMAVIKVIKFNVKFNVSEIVDKGMQLHIDKGQKAENCRRGNKVGKPRRCFFCFVRSLVGDSQQVDTASHCPTFQSQILTPALSKCT